MPDLTTKEGHAEIIQEIRNQLGEGTLTRASFEALLFLARSAAFLSSIAPATRLELPSSKMTRAFCQAIMNSAEVWAGEDIISFFNPFLDDQPERR